ncbi:MAG: diguanylate cyclase domain-containing protein [Janthinobacterium lividum]
MLYMFLLSALIATVLAAVLVLALKRERQATRLLREVVDSVPGGFVMWDPSDRLMLCNQAFRDTYALCGPALVRGKTFESVIRYGVSQGQYPQSIGKEDEFVRDLVQAHQRGSQTAERQLPNGRWILIHEERTPSGNIVAIRSDITAMKAALARVAEAHDVARHMASHDALTGLPNRVLFNERLDKAMQAFRDGGPAFSVLFLDLDHFKAVNDKLGHAGGDELLGVVAHRLSSGVRDGDIIARLSGDEFAMIVFGADAAAAAREVASALIVRVCAPYHLMTGPAAIGVSIGSAPVDTSCTRDELMSRADHALYEAKRAGRGTFRQFGAPRNWPRALCAPSGWLGEVAQDRATLTFLICGPDRHRGFDGRLQRGSCKGSRPNPAWPLPQDRDSVRHIGASSPCSALRRASLRGIAAIARVGVGPWQGIRHKIGLPRTGGAIPIRSSWSVTPNSCRRPTSSAVVPPRRLKVKTTTRTTWTLNRSSRPASRRSENDGGCSSTFAAAARA